VFLLPVGSSFEPWLQDLTALLILGGLDLAGIPYLYEQHLITISTGTWHVAPDCGGLRYLLPGLALGYAFATLICRRTGRRMVFLMICAAALMMANGVRAYGVIVGDHIGLTEGADHRIFSYSVFGVTIPFLYWIGWKLRESESIALDFVPTQSAASVHDTRSTILIASLSVAFLAVVSLYVRVWNGRI
jgi:exosortase